MGAVWLALDEVLGRQVALKRIGLVPGADSTDLARAEREARLAAHLNHPHVVAVFNFVVDADTDARWLVMEYVDGSTLAELVKEHGALSPDDAAPLLWQAADALAAAHAAGIVHRDVKPSNILVDRNRRVKLTDFGIARIAADPSLTQTGMVIGSPAYLAPEVAAGQRGDEAADVWSLGATLFHVLAGRPPYDLGDHVLGGLYRIVNEEPPRLPDAGWMAPLMAATLVKDPTQRWSMAQVRDFLAAPHDPTPVAAPEPPVAATATLPAVAADPEPTPAPPPAPTPAPAPGPAPAAPRRGLTRRGTTGLLVGLALLLVLALGVFLVLPDRGPSTTDAGGGRSPSASSSPSASPSSRTPSASPSPSATRKPKPKPTAAGLESFIRDYLATVGTNPDRAWTMLTPRFQRQSGGLAKYRRFWTGAGPGRVLALSADPSALVVSYRVKFENFGTGRATTVLGLVFRDGRYLIDSEATQG
jgi:serine/threonine protein kinase